MRHGNTLRQRSGGRRSLLGIVPALLLVAVVATGCTKMTGGGWIPSVNPTEKATFGFTAKCKTVTTGGLPAALLHEGQFDYTDPALDLRVHGDVEPVEFRTVPGVTCKQLAETDPNLQKLGGFEGTLRDKTASEQQIDRGEFSVVVFDGGKPSSIDGDEICVSLFGAGVGGLAYEHCGVVGGGNIRVE